jgi:hypothetical protein
MEEVYIDVKASEFLGTPAVRCRVVAIHYSVHNPRIEYDVIPEGMTDPDEVFQCDSEGYVLIGPPLNGELVRAP